MLHEQLARERESVRHQINDLERQLKEMHSDFEKCAKGQSPCFFCAKDDTCNGNPETCDFVWLPHNY